MAIKNYLLLFGRSSLVDAHENINNDFSVLFVNINDAAQKEEADDKPYNATPTFSIFIQIR